MNEQNEQQEEPVVADLNHPWVDASTFMHPRPVDCASKIESITLTYGDDEVDMAMISFVTPVGVFNFFLQPRQLNDHLLQGAQVLKEMVETASSQVVVANEEEMKDTIAAQRALKRLRN